jgi:hypothetical protein
MDRNLRVCFATFNLGNMWLVNNDLGQSFNVAGSGTYVVDNVRVMHGPNYFIPQGNVTLSIYNNNAGSNTPNAPVSASATKTYTPAPSSWNTVNLTSSVTLNKGATYWLVLNDTATEQPETRYTVRAGYYNGPQSLLFRPPSQAWDTNDRQDEPELLFEIRQGTTVQAGANQSRIYNRSLPMPLGDIANNEYDCAEAFMIRPWWPSTTVTGITTYHRLDTNNPTNDWITVTIQRDGGSFVASTGILTLPTGLPGANTPVRINYSSGGSSWSDELRTSTDVTHVSVNPSHLPVSSVSGVWLQSDALHTKTNYYSGPSGTILGTAQYKSPNAATSVSANFNSSVVLNYDTKYWLVWDAVPQATNKYYNLAAAGYKYGSHTYRVSGGAWQPPSEPDVMFQLNLATSGPISMTADSNFFRSPTAMDGEALKNYSLNGNWSNGEWAVISSISSGQLDYNDIVFYERMLGQTLNPDNKYAAILDRSVDWLDTDEVQLAHYVSGGSNNAENWYVAAGLVFDSSGGTVSLKTKSFATERDIGLVGDNRIELRADTGSSARALLASQFGSIYSTAPANDTTPFLTARRRTLAGLLYTQAGNVTFNSLCATDNDCPPSGSSQTGVAILGNNIKMSGYVYLDDNSTSIDRGGSYFNLTTSSVPTWQEQ